MQVLPPSRDFSTKTAYPHSGITVSTLSDTALLPFFCIRSSVGLEVNSVLLTSIELAGMLQSGHVPKQHNEPLPILKIPDRFPMHAAPMAPDAKGGAVVQVVGSLGEKRLRVNMVNLQSAQAGCDIAHLARASVPDLADSAPLSQLVLA